MDKRFCDERALIKNVTIGGGGKKNVQICKTSFMDDP